MSGYQYYFYSEINILYRVKDGKIECLDIDEPTALWSRSGIFGNNIKILIIKTRKISEEELALLI